MIYLTRFAPVIGLAAALGLIWLQQSRINNMRAQIKTVAAECEAAKSKSIAEAEKIAREMIERAQADRAAAERALKDEANAKLKTLAETAEMANKRADELKRRINQLRTEGDACLNFRADADAWRLFN